MPPISTESLPPMRTLNGEKYVDEPPPEFGLLARDRVLERRRARNGRDRERAVVRRRRRRRVITTTSPTERPCGALVWIVAVVPDELAPGIAGVAVPPPRDRKPGDRVRVLERACRRDSRHRERAVVAGARATPATVTVSPTWSVCAELVAIVTVVPFSCAPPRDVALGAALIVEAQRRDRGRLRVAGARRSRPASRSRRRSGGARPSAPR